MYSCISVHIIHVYNSRKQFQSYICRTQLLCDARNAIWHLETVERCLRGTRKERVNLVATVWRYFSQRWLEPETLWAAKGIARIRDNLEIFLGVCNGEIELLRRGKYITGQKKILVRSILRNWFTNCSISNTKFDLNVAKYYLYYARNFHTVYLLGLVEGFSIGLWKTSFFILSKIYIRQYAILSK